MARVKQTKRMAARDAIDRIQWSSRYLAQLDPKGPSVAGSWSSTVWTAWAGVYLLEERILELPADLTPQFLLRVIRKVYVARHSQECPYGDGAVAVAKTKLLQKHGSWDAVRDWLHSTLSETDDIEVRLNRVRQVVAEVTATAEAREFSDALDHELFAASLLHLGMLGQPRNYARRSVQTYFSPPDFPTTVDWDSIYRAIDTSLDDRLKAEIDTYLDSVRERHVNGHLEPPPGAGPDWRPLGSNALRTVITGIAEEMDDYMGWGAETDIRPLRVDFGPTDWHHIQGFCNRMGKDPEFRRLALSSETNWARDALPPAQNGRAPSFVAVHATLTGGSGRNAYLVLVQRPQQVHYHPLAWEGTMAENMMGPRKVTRDGINEIALGDADLHSCLLRGIEEEFALPEEELSEVVLTGFFAEAPYASIVAMFRVHTHVSFEVLRHRMSSRRDPHDPSKAAVPLEANVIAREPLSVRNLVRLVLAPAYAGRQKDGGLYEARRAPDEGRDYFVVGSKTGPMGFHPATSARILQLLLSDQQRFPKEVVVAAFEAEFAALGLAPS